MGPGVRLCCDGEKSRRISVATPVGPGLSLQNATIDKETIDHHVIPGSWRNEGLLTEMNRIGGNIDTRVGKQQRLYLMNYCLSPVGRVPWQDDMI